MTPRTIKRFVILILIVGLAVGLGYWTQRRQIQTMTQEVDKRAEVAAQEGDYTRAQLLYKEHLEVKPDDIEAQIHYAETILKVGRTPNRQVEAVNVYNNVLIRDPKRDDVRRALLDLEFDLGRYSDTLNDATILLKSNPDDGDLLFITARSREELSDEGRAIQDYQAAIDHGAKNRLEAYQRKAWLLRDRLNQPEQADQFMETMVKSDPENYQVYLERGRYRRRKRDFAAARADLEKASAMAPNEVDCRLALAETVELESGRNAARTILEKAIAADPTSIKLQEAIATLELHDGRIDVAVERLETALKTISDQGQLRLLLAIVLARRGDSGRLLLQIEELKKIGLSPSLLQYLMAYYYVNLHEYTKARQVLVPLQTLLVGNSGLKAEVNVLLAKCYSQLGEPGMQQDAYLRAISANPLDVSARMGYIANLVSQGDLDGAIQGYQALLERAPQARLPLARLLVTRNLQLPEANRDWTEVGRLLDLVQKDAPDAVETIIIRAEMLLALDKPADAQTLLEAAVAKTPKSTDLRNARASLSARQGRFDEALSLLDAAKKELGDHVEFRLQRARLIALRKGPGVAAALKELAEGVDARPKNERATLLNGLAGELVRLQEYDGAIQLWSRLAEDDPDNMELRLTLLDLAFQTGDRPRIETNIERIQKIEGTEGLLGRYCQVRYLIWQAQRETDADHRDVLRTQAGELLTELLARRQDWSVLPLAQAELAEQELARLQPADAERRRLQETIVNYYLRAIDLGQKRSVVVRRAVELLFGLGRGDDALMLFKRIPVESQLAGDLGRTATRIALENRDFQRAEEIARRSVAANPGNFQERIWLVQVLVASGRQPEAESELRQAVDLAKSDPDRWLTMVQFLVSTKQPDKAEKTIREAERALSGPRAPIALAQCDELMGRGYEGVDQAKVKAWYDEARKWYEKARAAAPEDFVLIRRLTEFLLRTRQLGEAEIQLSAVMRSSKSPDAVAWARRTLALALASSGDFKKIGQALELMSSPQPATAEAAAKPVDPEEDQRVLARVLDAQKTPEHRKQAIKILRKLLDQSEAGPEDRYLLARLLDIDGDWPGAQEQYRELVLRTETARDVETLTRRPLYLAQFANGLIRHRRSGDESDLVEAGELVDKMRRLQPDSLGTLVLDVELNRARNQIDRAASLIEGYAARGNLPLTIHSTLAEMAEKLGRLELAERLYTEIAALPTARAKLMLAAFLGRHDRSKAALDLCEPLWADSAEIDLVARTSIEALFPSSKTPDKALMDRVAGWFDKALAKTADSTTLLVGLGNLRERQGLYPEAQALYSRAIQLGDKAGISLNNYAWLMALKDGKGKDALEYINQAIAIKGPLPDFLDTRGVVYMKSGDSQRAISDLENAIAADPTPSKFFHLAQAYLEINNKEKAKQSLDSARGKGLTLDGLHPLEQSAYRRVVSELGSP